MECIVFQKRVSHMESTNTKTSQCDSEHDALSISSESVPFPLMEINRRHDECRNSGKDKKEANDKVGDVVFHWLNDHL